MSYGQRRPAMRPGAADNHRSAPRSPPCYLILIISDLVGSIRFPLRNFLVAFFFVAMRFLPVGEIAPWGGHDAYTQFPRQCKRLANPCSPSPKMAVPIEAVLGEAA